MMQLTFDKWNLQWTEEKDFPLSEVGSERALMNWKKGYSNHFTTVEMLFKISTTTTKTQRQQVSNNKSVFTFVKSN